MSEIITYSSERKYDPTHTTVLRGLFAKEINQRFMELAKVIAISVVKNDCFALKKNKVQIFQMSPLPSRAFEFTRSQDKLVKFMEWLQNQINAGIITVQELEQIGTGVESFWTNKYIFDSYKRGLIRARYELLSAGYDVPRIEETGGINAIMNLPMHIDRLGLIYTRVYQELKGITASMDTLISRILAQGLADGDNPTLLAKKILSAVREGKLGSLEMTDTLGRFIPAARRAELLARTEVIRAHHLATIQEYRNWGLLNIKVKAEWKTAGDERVCEKCGNLEGKIFTLDEIEPLIPLHPLCRCIALPYVIN